MGIKPGYKTTEFWIALISQITGTLVLWNIIGSEQSGLIYQIIENISALMAIGISGYSYSKSRSEVKSSFYRKTIIQKENRRHP